MTMAGYDPMFAEEYFLIQIHGTDAEISRVNALPRPDAPLVCEIATAIRLRLRAPVSRRVRV